MATQWKAVVLWEIAIDAESEADARIFFDGLAGIDLPAILDEPLDNVRSAVVFVQAVVV